jgi:predicted nuclease of predicted toxin-antitoxin system
LRGHSDADVYAYAQTRAAVLISCDKGFANLLQFPIGTHAGIIVVRISDEKTTAEFNTELVLAVSQLQDESLDGCLVIVEMGRIRLRRPSPR